MKYKIDSTRLALLATLLASLLLVALMRAYAPMRTNDNAATANINAMPTPPKANENAAATTNSPVVQTDVSQISIRDNQTPDIAPTPLNTKEIHLRGDLRFKTLAIGNQEAAKEFEVDIEYPQLVSDTGGNAGRVQAFNQEARRLVYENASWALKDKHNGEKNRKKESDEIDGGFINAGYDVTYASDELISVKFSACGISGSAASAACDVFILNYDLQNSKVLKPRDIFKPRSDYVQTLMAFCEPKLQERYRMVGSDYTSVAERAKEYQHLVITTEGIEVAFSEYTFAPGAAGIHSVLVPFEVIKDKLNPRTPIARLTSVAND